MTWQRDLHAVILAFLNRETPTASEVVKISGRGTDWAGSTEDGFGSQFRADVTYLDLGGQLCTESFEGEAMGDLWAWVVGGEAS